MARIFVGMSGGLDSSAAAWLLVRAGHDVTGITFLGPGEEGTKKCCSVEEISSARQVCSFLGIPHRMIDVRDIFTARIQKYFADSYRRGLTPNPCVYCNRAVKFGALLETALSEGADRLATGHYVRLVERDGRKYLGRARDTRKDQSYFLSYVEPEKLSWMEFPLGDYTKDETRALVRESGMPIRADKGESQDICFVPSDYRDYLRRAGVQSPPGDFWLNGRVVGKHPGIAFVSYGQRRGLNVAAGRRVFAREFHLNSNRIVLGGVPRAAGLLLKEINVFGPVFEAGRYEAVLRYQSAPVGATVQSVAGGLRLELDHPVDIVTLGQFGVLYRDGLVMASGVISDVELLPDTDDTAMPPRS